MEKVYTTFGYNQEVIAHEFQFQGVPLAQTHGEHPFDFYLPNGKSLEVKIDLRSQCTGSGAIEWPTLQRQADFCLYKVDIDQPAGSGIDSSSASRPARWHQ